MMLSIKGKIIELNEQGFRLETAPGSDEQIDVGTEWRPFLRLGDSVSVSGGGGQGGRFMMAWMSIFRSGQWLGLDGLRKLDREQNPDRLDTRQFQQVGFYNEDECCFYEVAAARLGENIYCLTEIPTFVGGVARGDIVETEPLKSFPSFVRLVRPSGHRTILVTFGVPVWDQTVKPILTEIKNLGCDYIDNFLLESFEFDNIITIDVPSKVAVENVTKYLDGLKLNWKLTN